MHVISVNVGEPQEVTWKGMKVQTSIFKNPVSVPLMIERLNLDGDRQSDLSVHGGIDKAVYAYPSEHYDYWRRELPNTSLSWGTFGENLTTEGMVEDTLCIGDRLRVGSAALRVTQPRMPCYKLGLRFDRDDMIKKFLISGRFGFYFSVIETGLVASGSTIEILDRDPSHVTIAEVAKIYLGKPADSDLVHRVLALTSLPQSWKSELHRRMNLNRAES